MRKDLENYISFFILQLEYKKNTSNNETKVELDSIIKDTKETIKDISHIKSDKYVFEYGEYIQEYAEKNDIILPPFVETQKWKPLYRNYKVNDLLNG